MTPKGSPVPRSRFGIKIIAVIIVVASACGGPSLSFFRRHSLSTFIIILTRVLSASSSSSIRDVDKKNVVKNFSFNLGVRNYDPLGSAPGSPAVELPRSGASCTTV